MHALLEPPTETDRGSQTIHLADGRTLGFAEWGDPHGRPVFLFHGTPGSRLTRPADESPLHARGVRLLTLDRPGYGISDPCPGRRLRDWPADVAALADMLGLHRFCVVGVSGGGPHALACAAMLPDRVAAVALVGGAAPMGQPGVMDHMMIVNRLAVILADHLPIWSASWPTRELANLLEHFPRFTMRVLTAPVAAPDRAILTRPSVVAETVETIHESFRHGTWGVVEDIGVLAHPWGFAPAAIRAPVYLWHGLLDRSVPVAGARYLARTLPACRATFLPDEAHELIYTHWPEILDAILSET